MRHRGLILGDLIALTVVTLAGFASHGELNVSFLARIAAALVPLVMGWFLLAPSLGLFDEHILLFPSQLWRPTFAMFFAGPFATLLRGIVLNAPIMPSFAVVFTLTSAAALTLWRLIWMLLQRRAN
jgi:hypothetical protein